MQTAIPVAAVTSRTSLRRAMLLILYTAALVLLGWLLAVTAAHADSGNGRDAADRPDGLLGLSTGTVEETLAPVRRAPIVRAVVRTGVDTTRNTVDTVTDSPVVQALPPVVDPVLASVDDTVTPVLEAVDPASPQAEDPPPSADPATTSTAPGHRPPAGLSVGRSAEPPPATLLGATAGAVSSAAPVPTLLASPAAVSPRTAAAATPDVGALPNRAPWGDPPGESPDTDAGGGPGPVAVVPDRAGTPGDLVVPLEDLRRPAPPSLPAHEPGSTPD